MSCPLKAIEDEIMKCHEHFIKTINPECRATFEKFYDAIIYGLEPIYINCADNCYKNIHLPNDKKESYTIFDEDMIIGLRWLFNE